MIVNWALLIVAVFHLYQDLSLESKSQMYISCDFFHNACSWSLTHRRYIVWNPKGLLIKQVKVERVHHGRPQLTRTADLLHSSAPSFDPTTGLSLMYSHKFSSALPHRIKYIKYPSHTINTRISTCIYDSTRSASEPLSRAKWPVCAGERWTIFERCARLKSFWCA